MLLARSLVYRARLITPSLSSLASAATFNGSGSAGISNSSSSSSGSADSSGGSAAADSAAAAAQDGAPSPSLDGVELIVLPMPKLSPEMQVCVWNEGVLLLLYRGGGCDARHMRLCTRPQSRARDLHLISAPHSVITTKPPRTAARRARRRAQSRAGSRPRATPSRLMT